MVAREGGAWGGSVCRLIRACRRLNPPPFHFININQNAHNPPTPRLDFAEETHGDAFLARRAFAHSASTSAGGASTGRHGARRVTPDYSSLRAAVASLDAAATDATAAGVGGE